MKTIFFLVSLFIFSLSALAQQSKIDFKIPEDEYQINRLIDKLENENKVYKNQIEGCNRLMAITKIIKSGYESLNKSSTSNIKLLKSEKESLTYSYVPDLSYDELQSFELVTIADKLKQSIFRLDRELYLNPSENEKYDLTAIKEDISNIVKDAEKAITEISKIKTRLDIIIIKNETNLGKLYKSRGQRNNIHRIAIIYGLPSFCITILLLFLYPYYLERNKESSNSEENNKRYLLDVATVLLLTLTILILGLAKMISSEVLGTLLGGISGYVLNKTMKK